VPDNAEAAAFFGFLIAIPSLQLRGDYLAIATLGFGEIIRAIMKNWTSLTRGPLGIPGIPKASFIITFDTPLRFIILAAILALITIGIIWRLVHSPFGRVLRAIREDELAAQSLGKNTTAYKTIAVVIGAGFAGLRALWKLRGMGKRVVVLEAADGIGGVWYHNGYPGARCDVESYDYSYSFSPELEQEWRWSERYATQPEILRYIDHVAERFDLRRDIVLNTRMESAVYDETRARWTITATDGRQWSTQYLVMAVGQLSTTKAPEYPGQSAFKGEIIHSGIWPKHEVDFEGKRVAIIGTGSSGMQMTPVVAKQASHLTVFQRTPNYSIPAANAPGTEEEQGRLDEKSKVTCPECGHEFAP